MYLFNKYLQLERKLKPYYKDGALDPFFSVTVKMAVIIKIWEHRGVMEGELRGSDAVGVVGRSQIPLWLHRR